MIKNNVYNSKCVVVKDNIFLFEVHEFDRLVPNLLKSPFICFFPQLQFIKGQQYYILVKHLKTLVNFLLKDLSLMDVLG